MTTKKEKPEDLIGFDDAAKLLQVSRRTIERLVQAGKLRTFKQTVAPGHGRGRLPRMLDRAQVDGLRSEIEETK